MRRSRGGPPPPLENSNVLNSHSEFTKNKHRIPSPLENLLYKHMLLPNSEDKSQLCLHKRPMGHIAHMSNESHD